MIAWIKDNVPGPILSIMGINSPSTVMAELGKDIARGLAVGIEAKAHVVHDASTSLADSATPALPRMARGPVVPLPQSAQYGSGSITNVGDTTYNVDVVVSLDDLDRMTSITDFLRMLEHSRVDARRTNRSGRVVV